ncbi:MAG: PH domain-containing protein, partial [Coriobacteriales bacterium]|nr:PH domain-containing protein [Coriobacteriales bacterium]
MEPSPVLAPRGGIAPGPHHIHPAYVIMNAVRTTFVVVFAAFISGIGSIPTLISALARGSDPLLGIVLLAIAGSLIAFLALTVFFSWLSYKRFLWEITQNDIHVYSGIIFKKQVHIPFQRVQSIDFKAGLLQRVIGIVTLKIETAGGAANKGVIIPALKLGEAEALRSEVFRLKKTVAQAQEQEMRVRIAQKQMAHAGGAGASGAGFAGTAFAGAGGALPPVAGGVLPPVAGGVLPPVAGGVGVVGAAGAGATGLPPVAGTVATNAGLPPVAGAAGAGFSGGGGVAGGGSGALPPAQGSSADRFVNEIGQISDNFRGVFADSYEADAPIEYEYGLKARELLFSAISGDHNLVTLAVIVGFLSQLPQIIDLFGFGDAVIQFAISTATRQALPYLITGVVFVAFILYVLTIVATAINYGGFKCRRRGGRIEVERGLLAKQYKSVAIPRIQSVEITQGFIRRLVGYAELRLKTVDSMNANSQQQNGQQVQTAGLVVHPFIKMSAVEGVLLKLVPEYDSCPTAAETHRLPPVAQRRAFMRLTVLPMLFVAACLILIDMFALIPYVPNAFIQPLLIGPWVLYALLCVLCIITSLLWYRHAAYGYNRT